MCGPCNTSQGARARILSAHAHGQARPLDAKTRFTLSVPRARAEQHINADSCTYVAQTSKVITGTFRALEAVALEGAAQSSLGLLGASRDRRVVNTARDLLRISCIHIEPVELLECFRRCARAPGAREGAADGAAEVRQPRTSGRSGYFELFSLRAPGHIF